jgi:hypothetical protein
VISATTPFTRDELMALRADASAVVAGRFPAYAAIYAARLADVPRHRARLRQREGA